MSTKEKDITKKRKPDTTKRVSLRNGFYFAQYRGLIAANIFAFMLVAVGLMGLKYFAAFTPPHKYIPTTADFRVLVSPPLNEEYLTEGDVIQLATNALRSVYTYDYVNWQTQLTGAQKWFTANGWLAFDKELVASEIIKGVMQREQVVSIRLIEAPYVKQKGLSQNGQFTWYVVFPKIEINYQAPKSNAKSTLLFTNYQAQLEVVRMPLDVNISGAAVNALSVGAQKAK